MSTDHYFIFGLIGFMALFGFAAFAYAILPPSCQVFGKPIGRGGLDSCICLLGLLSFLFGIGLAVYDTQRYASLGLILAGSGFAVLCLVILLRSRNVS